MKMVRLRILLTLLLPLLFCGLWLEEILRGLRRALRQTWTCFKETWQK